MAIEGELVVRITTNAGRVTSAQARAERPRVAGRLFAGRHADEAALLAGALFAVCGRSQAIAAAAAVEAARRQEATPSLSAARGVRAGAESIHEHAWRLLVDWPKLAGRVPEVECLAEARKALAPVLAATERDDFRVAASAVRGWAVRSVFGRAPEAFLALSTIDELLAWARETTTTVASLVAGVLAECATLGASDVALLPGAGTAWVAGDLGPAIEADDTFEDVPHWHGEPRETGPLARTASHPLVDAAVTVWGRGVCARVVARLVEMAQTIDALACDAGGRHGSAPAGTGCGIAWVETARGLLVHRVALEAQRITNYRIVAPTEWNFHPAGAFSRGAAGLAGDEPAALEKQVRWLVASLDPCVGVRYEATRA